MEDRWLSVNGMAVYLGIKRDIVGWIGEAKITGEKRWLNHLQIKS